MLFLLVLASLSLRAQDLSYEQTIAYISKNVTGRMMYPGDLDAYSRTRGYKLSEISIQRNGAIEIRTDQRYDANDFKISFNIFDLVQKADYPDGIRAYKFLVHFNGLNVSEGYGITFATDADAERVVRAFRHLKRVCVKGKDPFNAGPVAESKPQLNKEETVNYINQLLSRQKISYYEYENTGEKFTQEIIYNSSPFNYVAETKSYSFSLQIQQNYHYNPDADRKPSPSYKSMTASDVKLNSLISFDLTDIPADNKAFSSGGKLLILEMSESSSVGKKLNVYVDGKNAKDIERLKKAFMLLRELDADERDPFD